MKKDKAQSVLLGLFGVVLPGVAACAVLARALAFYSERGDGMAKLIVGLMAAGMLVGLVDLIRRVMRTAALHRELLSLPASAGEADVERASPPLGAVLRAHLEQAPLPHSGEPLTGYLVGLMVMLGLLGTLLGLFETLGGAGRALTESTNVDALREGLSAPMRGLTRSFGCSAAGVAASAMLGLSAVLVKRRELALFSAVQRYAAAALRELSPARRQLVALEQLAAQGGAMPAAASALDAVGGRFEAMGARWEGALARTAEVQAAAIREAFGGLRERVEGAALAATSALQSQLSPLLQASAESTERAAQAHLQALRQTLAADLERSARAETERSAGAGKALADFADGLGQALQAQTREAQTGFARLFSALEAREQEHRETLLRQRSEAAAHVEALGTAARALLTQLDDEAKARRSDAGTLLGELAEKLDAASRERATASREELAAIVALGDRMASDVEAREQRRSAAWTELAARVEQMAHGTRSEEEARLQRLDTLATRIGTDFGSLSTAMAKQLETRMEAEHALAERSRATMVIVEQGAHALETSIAEQKKALDSLLAESANQLSVLSERAQAGAAQALQRIIEVTDAQGQRFAALSAEISATQSLQTEGLAGELTAHAERLTDKVGEQADKLTQGLSAQATALTQSLSVQADRLTQTLAAQSQQLTTDLVAQTERVAAGLGGASKIVEEAAELLKASGVEMTAVAEMFGKSVERQRETAKTWLESLGELEGAIERVGRGAAADALGDQLASTQEVFARQLQFQRELFEQLRTLRVGSPSPSRGDHDVSA
jgi:hypothetical protein